MNNQNLFKEAIADAKQVRDAALANAKKSLAETFNPKVESMLNKKLAEMEESQDLDEAEAKNEGTQPDSMEEELDSILKELGMDESEDVNESEIDENEGEEEEVSDEPEAEAEPEFDGGEEEGGEFDAEGGEESQPVAQLNVDQFTELIRNIVQDVMAGGQGEEDPSAEFGGGEEEMGAPAPDGGEEEIDLDELMAELADTNEGEEVNEGDDVNEGEEVNESDDVQESKQWYNKTAGKGGAKNKGIKEATKGVDESKQWYTKKVSAKKIGGPKIKEAIAKNESAKTESAKTESTKVESLKKELAEAIKVIRVMKESSNSINLLNAKLLYANKIFKAKSLTESQKVKVVSAFDRARTKNEAKNIYESLNETLATKKSTIKESFGFASKATGTAPRKEIIVEDATVSRMKKLAGII